MGRKLQKKHKRSTRGHVTEVQNTPIFYAALVRQTVAQLDGLLDLAFFKILFCKQACFMFRLRHKL